MLFLYTGNDSKKMREALARAVESEKRLPIRITDAHRPEDLAAMLGGGLFAEVRTLVLEGVFSNELMKSFVLERLAEWAGSNDAIYLVEEKIDAPTKKKIEKHAHTSLSFEVSKSAARGFNVFALADALKRGDKKGLWISYQNALLLGNAPEAIHGILFWGAKDLCIKARAEGERVRARALVAQLVALPHEARRKGEDMEYALERFVLSRV